MSTTPDQSLLSRDYTSVNPISTTTINDVSEQGIEHLHDDHLHRILLIHLFVVSGNEDELLSNRTQGSFFKNTK